MARRIGARRDAPALRFLLLCVGGWIALRVMMVWNPAMSVPAAVPAAPWMPSSPFAASGGVADSRPSAHPAPAGAAALRSASLLLPSLAGRPTPPAPSQTGGA